MADNYDYVTTLYDFYGFVRSEKFASCEDIEGNIKANLTLLGKNNIIPYLQKHEFEALLFSDLQVLCKHIYYNLKERQSCYLKLKSDMENLLPEDINGQENGIPSKRLLKIFPHYKKSVHGYIIAQDIGIDKIRAQCPRFNRWIESLLGLENS